MTMYVGREGEGYSMKRATGVYEEREERKKA